MMNKYYIPKFFVIVLKEKTKRFEKRVFSICSTKFKQAFEK